MDVIGLVFARGGSKGIPNKNMQVLINNSILDISIIDLQNSISKKSIYVSSDSEEILERAKQLTAKTIKRPLELAGDNSSEILSWKHAVDYLKLSNEDIVVVAPTTSPFRSVSTVKKAIKLIQSHQKFEGVIAVMQTSLHPSFNMVRLNNSNSADLWDSNKDRLVNRQQGENCAEVTTVCFCYKVSAIRSMSHIFDGNIGYVIVSQLEGFDIDTPVDLSYSRYIANSDFIHSYKLYKDYF